MEMDNQSLEQGLQNDAEVPLDPKLRQRYFLGYVPYSKMSDFCKKLERIDYGIGEVCMGQPIVE